MEKYVNDYSILEPYHYLSRIPGKDVRGLLVDSFQTWLRIPEDKVEVLGLYTMQACWWMILKITAKCDVVFLWHTPYVCASLYHIVISKFIRTYISDGTPNTINCANYVYFIAWSSAMN